MGGLSKDAPSTSKSLTVGFVAGLAGPAALPLDTLGSEVGTKVAVGTYNAILNGTAAYGGNAIASPSSDPSANAATGAASYGIGVRWLSLSWKYSKPYHSNLLGSDTNGSAERRQEMNNLGDI